MTEFNHKLAPSLLPKYFGMLFFTGMMATGYYYNLTFIQFGLLDLGTRLVGLSESTVAQSMALLALVTSIVAITVGWIMMRKGWSQELRFKLQLAFFVVLVQTLLTGAAPMIRSQTGFLAWIMAASLALGVGVPATFSMTVDLIPVRNRGIIGAAITAAAYFPAAVFSPTWTIESFARAIMPLMAAGTIGLGMLAFLRIGFIDRLASQHKQPEFGRGRFIVTEPDGNDRIRGSLLLLIILMFGIYFVDSLGFLRLADTPFFFDSAWQSPETGPRLAIGIAHVLAAMVAGVLYSALNEKELFLWIFGIFAMVHLMYTFTARSTQIGEAPLIMPVLYAVAVSLYTVVNFALWADISTPRTISRNTSVGVALSGWTATFLSTALALRMAEIPLETHLRIVDSLAMLFFLLVLLLIYFSRPPGRSKRNTSIKKGTVK
jgi:MFS family permease